VQFVKSGGRIVYITCSMLNDENGDQIAAFLARHSDFRLEPPAAVIDASGLTDAAKETLRPTAGDFGMLLTPRRTNTDGFFVAVVRKG
jgi:16S rRNA (cytosine967-C5)-methyltransferase